ncbi:MAG: glycosyltransferase [Aeromicrobium sp.]
MIGYYIHHHGQGHLHRAISVAAATDAVVVGISSLPRPAGWNGPWMVLPRDDEGPAPVDATAHGRLHWVPEMDEGLTARMAEISSWIADVDPCLMVVDVSVEVSLLARLHGIPVITMVLPGDRRDSAHDLVHSVARRVVAAWPSDVAGMVTGVDLHCDRLTKVGGLSRFDGRDRPTRTPAHPDGRRTVLVLAGAGDAEGDRWDLAAAREQTPGWCWAVLGPGTWVDDPWALLCEADVIVTHAGQNAIAEVAAARRPAVVVPKPRPFREQDAMAAVLGNDGRFPVVIRPELPSTGWAELLESAAALDGSRWCGWNDGGGASRFADVIHEELARAPAIRS